MDGSQDDWWAGKEEEESSRTGNRVRDRHRWGFLSRRTGGNRWGWGFRSLTEAQGGKYGEASSVGYNKPFFLVWMHMESPIQYFRQVLQMLGPFNYSWVDCYLTCMCCKQRHPVHAANAVWGWIFIPVSLLGVVLQFCLVIINLAVAAQVDIKGSCNIRVRTVT